MNVQQLLKDMGFKPHVRGNLIWATDPKTHNGLGFTKNLSPYQVARKIQERRDAFAGIKYIN